MKSDRREFLKKATVVGAGVAMAMSPMSKALAGNGSTKKVRLAFIGTGGRGRYLLEHLLAQEATSAYEVTGICDNYQPSIDATQELCKKYGIAPKAYSDHKTLIKECAIDGVVIATPLHEHAHITIDCLKAGIHVLCEKSMARTLDEVKAMYDAHIQSGAILLIGHQRMFNKRYLAAMQQIHNGDLGQIGQIKAYWHRNNNWRRPVPKGAPHLERKINWRLYKEYSAGLLTELMSHQVQVSNWALQKIPTSVVASGSVMYYKDGREVPDNLAAIFSYEDGPQFIYDSMTINKKFGCEEHIIGDTGTMQLETNLYHAETPPPAPGILQLVNDIEKGLFKSIPIGGASWIPETAVKYNGEPIYTNQVGDGTREELVEFVSYIQKKENPNWITRQGYYSGIWSLLTEQAIETGTRVTMPEKYRI